MSEDRNSLIARARWCRRLAKDCGDEQLKNSLEELAGDYDRRASGTAAAASDLSAIPTD